MRYLKCKKCKESWHTPFFSGKPDDFICIVCNPKRTKEIAEHIKNTPVKSK